MYFVRIIDDAGLFIEDAFVEALNERTIATPCPDGFYHPKWNGTQWVEGGTKPEPVITVEQLKQQLADTDYRIIKCYEYELMGLPLPYDIAELHASRQAIRDTIADMEGE